ncbi:hypothetical protein QL285_050891 [Trifolium repens]|nr:hypothetical protein QL285_050891 [Trifolium repens]
MIFRLSMAWKEIARWLGISVAFVKGGYDHFLMFKGLISGRTKVKERLGILWLSTVDAIWKARNAMIFNNANFNWERVVEDIKVSSWKILKARDKNFSCSLYEWNSNPLICMGAREFEGGIPREFLGRIPKSLLRICGAATSLFAFLRVSLVARTGILRRLRLNAISRLGGVIDDGRSVLLLY